MLSLKKSYLCLLMIAPVSTFAASTCITVNGGWPNGGTTFVAPGLATPAKGACAAFSGFAKTATSVILNTSGSGCLSSDGKVFTLTLASTNPNWIGIGNFQSDYIRLCTKATDCPVGNSFDFGPAGGIAATVTCTSAMLQLPSAHD